jgi:hypothetical protein
MYGCFCSLQNKLDKNDEFNALKKQATKPIVTMYARFFSLQKKIDKNNEFNALKNKLQQSLIHMEQKKKKTKQENYLCVKAKSNLKYFFQSILLGLASFE